MAKKFRHKRPSKPERDAEVFRLLRLMRGKTTAELARASWVAPSTISKLRTRRTRYPSHITIVGILGALGYRYAVVSIADILLDEMEKAGEAEAARQLRH